MVAKHDQRLYDHPVYIYTPLPKQFLVPRKKPKKRSIPHVPESSVDSENISRKNIFATFFLLFFCYFCGHLELYYKVFIIILYTFLGSKFDSEQKSIPVNFHKKL